MLGRHTDAEREFITSVSILDRLCAPLCDFVAERIGSAVTLRELERSNMFLVPLDEHGEWYRFHHLFATAARSELAITHPDRVSSLHDRAATWFRKHGHVDDAIRHLVEAGNTGEAALLVQANWVEYVVAGRTATVAGWLRELAPSTHAKDPAAGVTAAWVAAMSGDEAALAMHLAALREFEDSGPLPDGSKSLESAIAMIEGLFGFGGPIEMAVGARRAVELETDGRSPFYAIALMSLGHVAYVEGDLDRAGSLLARAMHNDAAQAIIQVMSASFHSLVEAENGHLGRALELCRSCDEHRRGERDARHASGVDSVHGARAGVGSDRRPDRRSSERRPCPRHPSPQPDSLALADDAPPGGGRPRRSGPRAVRGGS